MKQTWQYHSGALCWALAAMLCAPAPRAAAASLVVYPMSGAFIDSRYEYDWSVLRMALEKSAPRFGPFDMRQSIESMSPARITEELAAPAGRINLFVRATTRELERTFLPIRIPVDRGLLGFRIFLVRAADLPRYAAVRSVGDLRRFHAGQGKGWADIPILAAAGLSVVEGTSYDGLFSMLSAGRFDYFSRAVDEAQREFNERHVSQPELAIEPTLLLHYPLPRYFFVRRDADGKQLAQRIEAGLEMMIRDGSLNGLFYRYKGAMIEAAGLNRRHVLQLNNPTLSPETPLARRELWYDPVSGK